MVSCRSIHAVFSVYIDVIVYLRVEFIFGVIEAWQLSMIYNLPKLVLLINIRFISIRCVIRIASTI